MAVGRCRAGSYDGSHVLYFTYVSPKLSNWYLVEFSDSQDDFSFDDQAEAESLLRELDVVWYPEAEAREEMLQHFPAYAHEPGRLERLLEAFWRHLP